MTMNIYINIANLEKLNKENNKSGLINQLLDVHFKHKTTFPAVQMRDNQVFMAEAETPEKEHEAIFGKKKFCKHGADSKFCRFAKPGKSCK